MTRAERAITMERNPTTEAEIAEVFLGVLALQDATAAEAEYSCGPCVYGLIRA